MGKKPTCKTNESFLRAIGLYMRKSNRLTNCVANDTLWYEKVQREQKKKLSHPLIVNTRNKKSNVSKKKQEKIQVLLDFFFFYFFAAASSAATPHNTLCQWFLCFEWNTTDKRCWYISYMVNTNVFAKRRNMSVYICICFIFRQITIGNFTQYVKDWKPEKSAKTHTHTHNLNLYKCDRHLWQWHKKWKTDLQMNEKVRKSEPKGTGMSEVQRTGIDLHSHVYDCKVNQATSWTGRNPWSKQPNGGLGGSDCRSS